MIFLCLYEKNKWKWGRAIIIKKFFKKYKKTEEKEDETEPAIKTETLNQINKIYMDSEFKGWEEASLKDLCEFHSKFVAKDIRWIVDEKRKALRKSEFKLKDENEAVQTLKATEEKFPEVVDNFIRKSTIFKNISTQAQKISMQVGGIKRKQKDKPKKTIFQALTPLTQEDWKKQPKTYRNFLEQANIRQMNYTLKITDEKREASFFRTLKKLETYFSRYSLENKEKASVLLSEILKRSDIQERPDIQERIKVLIKDAKQNK